MQIAEVIAAAWLALGIMLVMLNHRVHGACTASAVRAESRRTGISEPDVAELMQRADDAEQARYLARRAR